MRPSESIRSISYLKAHTAEIIRTVTETRTPLIVTQNGEAKVVVQDIYSYEQMQESLAMLKLLAQSSQSIRDGDVVPAEKVFSDLKKRLRARK
ncbi:MAG: type II toxin-antitoxin system Phd/YefM family antitoxin [Candidatus Marinimicrobia bacterium]|nr:type II toxin-antitoxin system Phd/YefM family antitoxin [Candidatus Neomarinimicrobiota bacterium]